MPEPTSTDLEEAIMRVLIDCQHIELPSQTTVEHHVQRVFTRFADRLERVALTLRDDNGPRGGRDKLCTLRADLRGGGQIIVVDRCSNLKRAIMRSLRRGRSLVARELKRRQRNQRRCRLVPPTADTLLVAP